MNNKQQINENKAIEGRRLYQREWRKRNKDKVKQYNARYFEKFADQHQENTQNMQNN